MKRMFWVYIMSSTSGTLYIGITSTLFGRALQHKDKLIKGFTSRYDCNRLVYYEGFDDVRKAISREKEPKGWVRKKKIALIESVNPRWEDLSKTWGGKTAMQNQAITDSRENSNLSERTRHSGDPSLRSG